jgi:hypothetical protein
MDTKQIIDMHLNAIAGEKEEIRKRYLDELNRLGTQATTAAEHAVGALPTLAWLETGMARLRELQATFEKAECARETLRRVSEAAEFESRKASV